MPQAVEGYCRKLRLCLLVECSGPMVDEHIVSVRATVEALIERLRNDPAALELLWISLITFDERARQLLPLTDLAQWRGECDLPSRAEVGSCLAAGLRALREAIAREVRQRTHYQKGDWAPVVVVFSNSRANGESKAVWAEMRGLVGTTIVCVAGSEADPRALAWMADEVLFRDSDTSAWLEGYLFPPTAMDTDMACHTKRPVGIRPHPMPYA